MEPATEALSEFIVSQEFESLPPSAIERAKDSFLDTLGIALAGAVEPGARIVVDYLRRLGGPANASLLGSGLRTAAPSAALGNGTMAHIVGFSDFSVRNVLHPSVAVLPAVWAIAEETGASGREVIAAHVLGVEVSCKLGAVLSPEFSHRGFHPCAIIGAFGATAAAGKLLGLDARGMANALGIAAVEASGIKVSLGTMSKAFAVGRAAENGVVAAQLARAGFSGATDALEGRDGFFQTYGAGVSGADMTATLGNPFEFVSPGITVKPYPSCTRSHPAIDAVLDVRQRHAIRHDAVQSVTCEVSPEVMKVVKVSNPRNPMEAKFSMEFCVACAMLDGAVAMETFTDAKLADPRVRDLMAKVRTTAVPELKARAPFAARVTVRTVDGDAIAASRDRGPWEPGADGAASRRDQLLRKYRGCASRVLAASQIADTIDIVENLEREANLARLMDIVRR